MLRDCMLARWNGERPPYLRDRCEGCCGDGVHYHVPWAGWVGHGLILGWIVVIAVGIVLAWGGGG